MPYKILSVLPLCSYIYQTSNHIKERNQNCLTRPIFHKVTLTGINYIPILYSQCKDHNCPSLSWGGGWETVDLFNWCWQIFKISSLLLSCCLEASPCCSAEEPAELQAAGKWPEGSVFWHVFPLSLKPKWVSGISPWAWFIGQKHIPFILTIAIVAWNLLVLVNLFWC